MLRAHQAPVRIIVPDLHDADNPIHSADAESYCLTVDTFGHCCLWSQRGNECVAQCSQAQLASSAAGHGVSARSVVLPSDHCVCFFKGKDLVGAPDAGSACDSSLGSLHAILFSWRAMMVVRRCAVQPLRRLACKGAGDTAITAFTSSSSASGGACSHQQQQQQAGGVLCATLLPSSRRGSSHVATGIPQAASLTAGTGNCVVVGVTRQGWLFEAFVQADTSAGNSVPPSAASVAAAESSSGSTSVNILHYKPLVAADLRLATAGSHLLALLVSGRSWCLLSLPLHYGPLGSSLGTAQVVSVAAPELLCRWPSSRLDAATSTGEAALGSAAPWPCSDSDSQCPSTIISQDAAEGSQPVPTHKKVRFDCGPPGRGNPKGSGEGLGPDMAPIDAVCNAHFSLSPSTGGGAVSRGCEMELCEGRLGPAASQQQQPGRCTVTVFTSSDHASVFEVLEMESESQPPLAPPQELLQLHFKGASTPPLPGLLMVWQGKSGHYFVCLNSKSAGHNQCISHISPDLWLHSFSIPGLPSAQHPSMLNQRIVFATGHLQGCWSDRPALLGASQASASDDNGANELISTATGSSSSSSSSRVPVRERGADNDAVDINMANAALEDTCTRANHDQGRKGRPTAATGHATGKSDSSGPAPRSATNRCVANEGVVPPMDAMLRHAKGSLERRVAQEPGLAGVDSMRLVHSHQPSLPIILTSHSNGDIVLHSLVAYASAHAAPADVNPAQQPADISGKPAALSTADTAAAAQTVAEEGFPGNARPANCPVLSQQQPYSDASPSRDTEGPPPVLAAKRHCIGHLAPLTVSMEVSYVHLHPSHGSTGAAAASPTADGGAKRGQQRNAAPSSRLLLTGSHDASVRAWLMDASSCGKPYMVAHPHTAAVRRCGVKKYGRQAWLILWFRISVYRTLVSCAVRKNMYKRAAGPTFVAAHPHTAAVRKCVGLWAVWATGFLR